MSDYRENALVVQSNQFVRETSNNLKANEIKMFDVFVSCIDTMNPKNEITISKNELLNAMGDTGTHYTTTRDTLKSIFNKHWVQVDDEKTIFRHFIDKFEWYHDADIVKVEFHKDILPMLIELKKNFLQYSVADLNALKSRYSMLMYKYILSYIRQYKTLELTMEIDEMKEFLNIKNKYNRYEAFERRVLKIIESEINESKTLPYLIRYDKLAAGRKIKRIRFQVRPRTTNNETHFADVQNPLIYEEMCNDLIKGDVPLEEIRNRQADTILNEQ